MLFVGSGRFVVHRRHGGKLILYFVHVVKEHPKIKLLCTLSA